MQAVVCHGPRDYRLEELPVPEPGPGEALVPRQRTPDSGPVGTFQAVA
jgi:NADPH:quinone reductase-like Zn-dependent oxidoreductase